jgi:DNA end-binding protein Ku
VRAIWNGFISFGLVTIPVSVGLAQQRKDVSFRTLARATNRPVKQKRWDPENDVEVAPDDTIKGWEVSKGRYVPVEESELERFAARQEKTIQILQFVELPEVDPVYFERAYWLEPQERAERPYALLTRALQRSERAAVGRFVLSTKEHLVLMRPFDGMLALQTLYYPEDVRVAEAREVSERVAGVDVSDEELAMAEQLVEGLSKPFEPEAYPNETRHALLEFLEAKASGEEIAEPEEAPAPAPVVDLMAALKASLAAQGPDGEGDDEDEEDEAPKRKPARARSAKGKGTAKGKGAKDEGDEDDQLSIEQGRLRKVEGGGEGGSGSGRAKKAPQRRRKAS